MAKSFLLCLLFVAIAVVLVDGQFAACPFPDYEHCFGWNLICSCPSRSAFCGTKKGTQMAQNWGNLFLQHGGNFSFDAISYTGEAISNGPIYDLSSDEFCNGQTVPDELDHNFSGSSTSTFSFTKTVGKTIANTQSCTINIPFGLGSFSTSTTVTWDWSKSTTTTSTISKSWSDEAQITIPAQSVTVANYTLYNKIVSAQFTAVYSPNVPDLVYKSALTNLHCNIYNYPVIMGGYVVSGPFVAVEGIQTDISTDSTPCANCCGSTQKYHKSWSYNESPSY